ncbi:Chitin synthase, class 1 [Tulasnella sp. 332]|nr:Chitin synthase, class 1 [Tulasnella sp. 332]
MDEASPVECGKLDPGVSCAAILADSDKLTIYPPSRTPFQLHYQDQTTHDFNVKILRGANDSVELVQKYFLNQVQKLVIDCPVPSQVLDMCTNRTEREMTHMRYTAVTDDLEDFTEYALRQVMYDPPRRTELLIFINVRNEDAKELSRTMRGMMENLAHLCTRDRSQTWGKESWKKVVVCFVSDGQEETNASTLSTMAAMGIYKANITIKASNNPTVVAHIYEYTTQVSVSPELRLQGGVVPIQVILCIQEKYQKGINFHRQLLASFAKLLKPNIAMFLNVGAIFRPKSIYDLWKPFDMKSNVSGARTAKLCGLSLWNLSNVLQHFNDQMDTFSKTLDASVRQRTRAITAYRVFHLEVVLGVSWGQNYLL